MKLFILFLFFLCLSSGIYSTYAVTSEGDDLKYATEYNGNCTQNEECVWLGPHSECLYNQCKCVQNYRWYKGSCARYSGLDGSCNKDSDCWDGYTIGSLKCDSKNNVCTCNDGFKRRKDTDCRKAAHLGENCYIDFDCDDGELCKSGKCVKASLDNDSITEITVELVTDEDPGSGISFIPSKDANQPDVINCATNDDCKILSNSECYSQTKTCTCLHGYFYHNATTCAAELEVQACTVKSDCKSLRFSQCDAKTKHCSCPDYFFAEEDKRSCVKSTSSERLTCLTNEWCYALGPDGYCYDKTCKCSLLAQFNKTLTLCDPNYSRICKSDAQCASIKPNTICKDELCVCDDNHYDVSDACLARLNVSCTHDGDCFPENSVCDTTCQCAPGYLQAPNNNTYCFKKSQLYDQCLVDEQCLANATYTRCLEGICSCDELYTEIHGACLLMKKIDDYCTNQQQCQLFNKDLICRNSICQCPLGDTFFENSCVNSSSNSVPSWFPILTFLFIIFMKLQLFYK